jgi:CheY-like chemotaxis protein
LEKFGEVEKAVKQAKNLSNQLLTFAKGGVPVKKAVYVDELLNEVASLVLCGSNIVYEIIIPGKRCLMEVDEGQISQVINNIMINAVQAMPGGGIIRIAVEKIFAGTGELELLPIMKSGDYIKIAISDQGSGICEEYLPKIFDLFFTTKPEGSGLGLAIAYSVVRKHNGYISVDSRLGQGTTFYIYLPAYNGEPPDRPEEKQDIIVGRGRILIMDDNEALAEIVSDLLAELGYRTATARDGEKAVELYRQGRESGQPFDLVLMDLTVPGRMGGEVTIKILKEYDPEVKAIVTSGYSEDPVMREYERHGFKGFIVKPYLVEDLAREINRAINLKR